ncbi:MAG: lytic transglycosylase domain-containing protein [Myxococcales bacterium]|nr:lytic transglycosylase domain-containing protein [Myxococcales bacterium]
MKSGFVRSVVVFVAACAVATAPVRAGADIFVTRRADGTIHLSNVPSQRSTSSTVVIRSRDAQPSRRSASPVIAYDGSNTPVAQVTALGDAQVRSLYLATARDAARYARYDAHIREAAQLYQLPEAFIRAVIKQESDFNPYSVSSAGASGLMQLMPQTAQSMSVRDVFDPRQNILGGTRFLRVLANMFNGDLVLTVAAYNAGPNAVIRHSGVPPYEQTQHYVRQVLRYYYLYRAGQMPGQTPAEPTATQATGSTSTAATAPTAPIVR